MKRFYLFLLITVFYSSCANYKMNYSKEAKNWEISRIAPTDLPIKHTMYLIGDAGDNSPDKQLPT
ncbi:MAG: PBP1b-binding outer membrane lipoprotein LpoB, partial [Saprospiraceae bacterium]